MAAAKRGEVEPERRKNDSNCQDPREKKNLVELSRDTCDTGGLQNLDCLSPP